MTDVGEDVSVERTEVSNPLDVVVPVYNAGSTVEPAAERIAACATGGVRAFFVDDGSTDGSDERLDRLRGSDVIVHHQPNRGPSAARNAGATLGRGRWLAFVDIDDTPDPDWADRLLALTPGAGIVGCGGRFVAGDDVSTRTPTRLGAEFAHACVIFLPGLFIVRRSIFEAVGGYDERFRYSENTELALRVTAETRRQGKTIVSIAETLISVELPPAGRSRAYTSVNRLDSARLMLAKHGERLRSSPRHLASYEAIAGVESLRLGHRTDARRHLSRAVRLRPSSLRYWRQLVTASVPTRLGVG